MEVQHAEQHCSGCVGWLCGSKCSCPWLVKPGGRVGLLLSQKLRRDTSDVPIFLPSKWFWTAGGVLKVIFLIPSATVS